MQLAPYTWKSVGEVPKLVGVRRKEFDVDASNMWKHSKSVFQDVFPHVNDTAQDSEDHL